MKKLFLFTLTISFISCKVQQSNHPISSNSGRSASSDNIEISENTARIMTRKFHPHSIGFRAQTRFVWLSLERIKSLDSLLQVDLKNHMGTDGIRIYFAKYPAKDSLGKKYPHAHRNTLVFVSTKKNKDYHQDYFDGASLNRNKITSQNRGELCPNNCEGAELYNP